MTNPSSAPQITKEDIVTGLRNLGLTPASGLVVHSSLKSFGHVEGGAKTVIEALMEVLTPAGTLVMPSFNHGAAFAEGAQGYYDPKETPTTNGAIPDLFWRMPDVSRSLNPTHPFAAWGKHSQRYTQYHHKTLTMGPQSPLGLLNADGGFGLLLGVDYRSNTFHHVVEMSTEVPCLGYRTEAYPILLPDGQKVEARTWGWREKACPFTDENRYHEELHGRGLQQQGLIGNCRAIHFRLQDCFDVLAAILRQGKDGFPPCRHCPIRPRSVAQTLPSDWDKQGQCLLPDALAQQH